MAETLSYQEPQNVTTVDNLTAEEQDSLAVGESISQQEEQVYAGTVSYTHLTLPTNREV